MDTSIIGLLLSLVKWLYRGDPEELRKVRYTIKVVVIPLVKLSPWIVGAALAAWWWLLGHIKSASPMTVTVVSIISPTVVMLLLALLAYFIGLTLSFFIKLREEGVPPQG